ncbi:MAG: response regulator [Dissulfurispiraceae bacterium]
MRLQTLVIDGIEAIKTLQSEPLTRDIPVIALASYAMRDDRQKFISIGFGDYLAKPISIDELLELVNYYCT